MELLFASLEPFGVWSVRMSFNIIVISVGRNLRKNARYRFLVPWTFALWRLPQMLTSNVCTKVHFSTFCRLVDLTRSRYCCSALARFYSEPKVHNLPQTHFCLLISLFEMRQWSHKCVRDLTRENVSRMPLLQTLVWFRVDWWLSWLHCRCWAHS